MAQKTVSLALFAAVSIAMLWGTTTALYGVHVVDIRNPTDYKAFLAGHHDSYTHIYVKSNAHHDVLSEAKRSAHSHFYFVKFTEEHGDYILLQPRILEVTANFTRGNLFSKLPTDYRSYAITVKDESVITEADRRAITQWYSATNIVIKKA